MKLFPEPLEFTLFNLIKLFKLNIRFALLSIVMITSIVVIISYILPHQYASTSSLLPPKKDGSSGGLSSFIQNFAGGGLSLGSIGQSDQSKVFGEIVKSRTVAEYIIDTLKLEKNKTFMDMKHDKILKYLYESISVVVDKSGIIFIRSAAKTDFFPSSKECQITAILAADIANTAVRGLDKVIKERNMSSARKSKEYIEKEIDRYLVKLDSVQTRLEDFQKENKVLAIDEQTQAIVKQAIEVGAMLAKADLEKNLAQLEYNINSPQYEFYNKQYDLLSDQYRKIQSGGLTKNETFTFSLDEVPKLIKEYTNLFRERKVIEQVMLYLETQRHQEAIQEKRDVPVVEILDPAYPPEERESPQRPLMAILGFLLSIFFASVYIAIKGLKQKTLYLSESEISQNK